VLIGATPEGKKELLGFQVGGAAKGSAKRSLVEWLRRDAGKRAELARAAGRPQGTRPDHRAGAGDRRRIMARIRLRSSHIGAVRLS